ncbi:peptidyl-prolyl cis-trans isomerase FKBP13, chloroplastic isoform X1 [Cucurbita pepo subsp. pepo]|uniref:peptidylprolyl isomerase n=1 Tax=Cucurbita moschata TaxID=3662 RepID=A0A6J1EFM9_CUCMO|nr:peptidyl-prolyl cis-trans isomerase FKBP13, chloroplastic isoform X1 [Cucurbita moschata]XP_023544799.1 peptidyl-prolyl cis-trans isomerase FKBP13, chloroplastic isoform X1 [Cucurbita pepo subsp. pepo]
MSSLTISFRAATPRTLSSNNISPDKCVTTKQVSKFTYTRTPKISSSLQELEMKESPASFGRRGAIGCGFLLGLASVLLQPLPATAEATPCEFTTAPSGLAFCDKVVGTGPEAEKGQLIKAHYVGKLESGKVFDSSYNRGKPLTFRVGVGEVIKGWDEGILGGDGVPAMLPGGKRVLKLPPQLGYGARGAGCRGGRMKFLVVFMYWVVYHSSQLSSLI